MKYSDKLKEFVGGKGSLRHTSEHYSHFTFIIDSSKPFRDVIQEVKEDYVVIQYQYDNNKNLVYIPLNLFVVYS